MIENSHTSENLAYGITLSRTSLLNGKSGYFFSAQFCRDHSSPAYGIKSQGGAFIAFISITHKCPLEVPKAKIDPAEDMIKS